MNELSETQPSTNRDRQALNKTLQVISGKWRLLIIYQLIEKDRRYNDLRYGTPGISERILMRELNALLTMGVLQKKTFKEVPPRVEYSLTEKARTIVPLLLQLPDIGQTFLKP